MLHSKYIFDKKIGNSQNQSHAEEEQSKGHASGNHHAVFAEFFVGESKLMVVIPVFGVLSVNGVITKPLKVRCDTGEHMRERRALR